MKTLIKSILTIGMVAGFILCTAEAQTASMQWAWTLGCISLMTICGWGLNKLETTTEK